MGKRYGEKRDGAKIEDILSRLHYIDTIKEFHESPGQAIRAAVFSGWA